MAELDGIRIPRDARQPLSYLSERLGQQGFAAADQPVRVPELSGWGRQLLLVPFVHPGEHGLFVMGIESRLIGQSQIMLHIITPLGNGGRVETSTLRGLEDVVRPPGVDIRVVTDADSVEEIWSRHRLALTRHERSARASVEGASWQRHAAAAYDAWLIAAVRSNRLTLNRAGDAYQIVESRRAHWI